MLVLVMLSVLSAMGETQFWANDTVETDIYKTDTGNSDNSALGRIVTLHQENVPVKSAISTSSKLVRQIIGALETVWTQPIMVLIDDIEEVRYDAKVYMESVMTLSYATFHFWLMKFNSTNVTPILAKSINDKEYFLNCLTHAKVNSSQTSQLLEPEYLRGGVLFFALLKATRLLPKNSAILVFTNREVEDEDLAQLALKYLLEKEIKLYVIWNRNYPTINNEEKILEEISVFSGGEFLIGNTEKNLSKFYSQAYLKNPEATKAKTMVAFKTNITKNETLKFPIDSSVKSIHISITCSIFKAHLISPKGYIINILNNTEVEYFSLGSFIVPGSTSGRYEIQLNTLGVTTPFIGIWCLDIDVAADSAHGSDVTISLQTNINVTASILDNYINKEIKKSDISKLKKILKISTFGELHSIKNITIFNIGGLPIRNIESFIPDTIINHSVTHADSKLSQTINVEVDKIPKEAFYLELSGEDKYGDTFSRLSLINWKNLDFIKQSLMIEVNTESQLLTRSNQEAKIYFEITNNGDRVMYVHFMCQDQKSFLLKMEPESFWINPKQIITVTVTTYISSSITASFTNVITFTVMGPEKITKSAIMHVNSNIPVDTDEPLMTYRYTSDCMNVLLGNCEDGTWTIEVTAEDRISGLLQLNSDPKGLYISGGYITGTKEPVTAIYAGSCCRPKLQLIAIDMFHNTKRYALDAYYTTWSAALISAVTLGVLMLILLIIAIIILLRNRCCNEKRSIELPVYRSRHNF